MKLYGHPYSSCTQKVLLTLAEKGLKADFTFVDLAKGEQKSPQHMARQPFGVVPAFEDDDFRMYESQAIARYLDAKYPQNKLIPGQIQALGKMEQWISATNSYVNPPVITILMQKVLGPMRGQQTNQEKVNQAIQKIRFVLSVFDKELLSKSYLAGEEFSLADIFLMPYLGILLTAKEGHLIEEFPSLNAWWKRVSTRPSWQRLHQ
jgi:glutathione S-transferase